MLVLTRNLHEGLVIGDDVTLTIIGIKGNQVRIGINAPKEISVHREEIYERIQQGIEPAPKKENPQGDLSIAELFRTQPFAYPYDRPLDR